MRRFSYNFPRVYVLSVFFKGGGVETERFYSIGELLDALEEWEREPDFESAHLSIED
jgi:hypothetical protein